MFFLCAKDIEEADTMIGLCKKGKGKGNGKRKGKRKVCLLPSECGRRVLRKVLKILHVAAKDMYGVEKVK